MHSSVTLMPYCSGWPGTMSCRPQSRKDSIITLPPTPTRPTIETDQPVQPRWVVATGKEVLVFSSSLSLSSLFFWGGGGGVPLTR